MQLGRVSVGIFIVGCLALSIPAADAQADQSPGLYFSHISWKLCMDTPSGRGFYDPKFPLVCKALRNDPRAAGFTLTTSVAIYEEDNAITQSTALFDRLREEVTSYLSGDACVAAGNCPITMLRFPVESGVSQTSDLRNERRIGFRVGQGDKSLLPNPDLANDLSEKVQCISSGTSEAPNAPHQCTDKIKFVIDSLSRPEPVMGVWDGAEWKRVPKRIINMHFSFDVRFNHVGPSPTIYTVFFEGCCRPTKNDHSLALKNSAGTPWHVRTEIAISEDYSQLPVSSYMFEAVDVVQLPKQQNQECTLVPFFLQGIHPQSTLQEETVYRLGTINEMGKYKCLEHAITNNRDSPLVDSLTPGGVAVCIQQDTDEWGKANKVEKIEKREIYVDVKLEGFYAVTVVAETTTSFMVDDAPIVLSTTVDFIIKVWPTMNLDSNDGSIRDVLNFAPTPYYHPDLTPFSYNRPIHMDCGKPTFTLGAYSQDYIHLRYADPDQDCVSQNPHVQDIAWIGATHTLPKGVSVSFDDSFVAWDKYAELTWTPQCEDRSNIGKFLFCFAAQDALQEGDNNNLQLEYIPAISYSRTARDDQFEHNVGECCDMEADVCCDADQNPSCLYIEVASPKPNPRPLIQDSRDVLTRCNTACTNATDPDSKCYVDQSVVVLMEYELDLFSISSNDLFPLDLAIAFEDQNGNVLPTPPNMNVTKNYGCGGVWGARTCVPETERDPSNQNDVAVKLFYAAPQVVPETIFKICVQAVQLLPPEPFRSNWIDTWGWAPNNDTCRECFDLVVVDKPSFIGGTSDETYNVRIGETPPFDILLRGRGRLRAISILIKADPGAPIGSEMMEQSEPRLENGYWVTARVFRFMPQVGQEGQDYRVCFVVKNEDDSDTETLYSEPKCVTLRVPKLKLGYNRDGRCDHCCPTQTKVNATVGCTQRFDAIATKMDNGLGGVIDFQYPFNPFSIIRLPTCDDPDPDICPHPLSVHACTPESTGACCGNGVCDGAEMGSSCPEDCEPDTVSMETIGELNQAELYGVLTFSPTRQQQGRKLLMCVGAHPPEVDGGMAVIEQSRTGCFAPSLCFVIEVSSCRYCVPEGKTLRSIARHYFLNVDWLRLYNSNPEVRDPDGLLVGKQIQVGPLYTVQSGDTLLSIAAKTRTTVRSLMENNPQIPPDGMIMPDDSICVLVCSSA
mmetsp:Transcript_59658/g.122369  ORF Transcript_59658/g.122369 Transcript_59658/m.122369 type:complete len:1183 (+) Transcript_59658:230-3778(+)|eukprot:CAMPEP_0181305706 /NCGR_PEP_ID=MMETSP1101-20121128/9885_1 /TAXON_ID=46948 /ORGANISM="Rhodomonas abbreviata, Strain Caron Lab Isolate" /LENGTH=1182 /DNA_ID=CAMNT_0023411665 /DNA_START=223 /DNA_END=3771 /DNA_ORIENTATION=-